MSQVQTLLTGLSEAINGARKLKILYERILHLSEKLPKDAAYKLHLQAIISHRMCLLTESCGDRKDIEENICGGSLEMLIRQAEAEYGLLQKMLLWKPWEPLMRQPPQKQWDWPPVDS